MPIERTLIIVKPDAVQQGHHYEVLDRFRKAGLRTIASYSTVLPKDLVNHHYIHVRENVGDEIADRITDFMISSPVHVVLLEGIDAVDRVREMCGPKSQPRDNLPGTIRYEFSSDTFEQADAEKRALLNVIHSSDSVPNAEAEIKVWFEGFAPQLLTWKREKSHIDDVAEALGYVSKDWLLSIAQESNERKILYHGVKRQADLEQVLREGVLPKTPEGGYCSFWATGNSLFTPMEDSPLFCYSGNREHATKTELRLVMVRYEDMDRNELDEFKPHGQLQVHSVVSPDKISIVKAIVAHPEPESHGRVYRQAAE